MRIILCTGGFDPIHSGHIKLLNDAAELGDKVVVGVNSDEWLIRKKGQPFMPFDERVNIVSNMVMVYEAFGFDDSDGSASDAITVALARYPGADIVFANGGDRTEGNIPEMEVYDQHSRVTFEFSVGGDDKANSSSWILNEWKSPKTDRPWGYYRKLHQDGAQTHVKELAVLPGKSLSMQQHRHRNELWMVTSGVATVALSQHDVKDAVEHKIGPHGTLSIPVGWWHQLSNETDEVVKIVEIQYGNRCVEEDIIRVGVDEKYGASLYDQ